MKNCIMSLVIAGGFVFHGTGAVDAQTVSVAGILFDFSSCGDGSMCTNDGYICK